MKKLTVKCVLILAAVVFSLIVTGCSDTSAPGSASPPTTQPSASGSPAPTPPPSPSPSDLAPPVSSEPPEPDFGMLELDKYYYMDGDPDSVGYVFLSDGAIFDSEGIQGRFELDGENITVFLDGNLVATLKLIDEYTFLETESGIVYIREGGGGFGVSDKTGTGFSQILYGEYYYKNGDEDEPGFYFYRDFSVDVGTPSDWEEGVYSIDNDIITIELDGKHIADLVIINMAELLDSDNITDIYALEGALTREIVIDDYYYLDGDENAANLWFFIDGFVELEDPSGETGTGSYSVDGATLFLELGGETDELHIVNSYILESDWGFSFIRLPSREINN